MDTSQPLVLIADTASWVLIVSGSFFLVTGAIGLLRMPDVYTRMHAVSVMETLGATLLVLGLLIQAGPTLIAVKLLFVLALLFFFSPVASHALAQAALHAGIEPILNQDRTGRSIPDAPAVEQSTGGKSADKRGGN